MKRRVLFAIQGEGRGHMTQALALQEILANNNYEVVVAIIGSSPRRKIPAFVRNNLSMEIFEIESPNFITDKNDKGLDIPNSIGKNLFQLPLFAKQLKQIDAIVKKYRPDLIINFYEPLIGLYNKFYSGKHKTVCIAHQYLSLHPNFNLPKNLVLERKSLQFFSKITSQNSQAKLGLSFYEFSDCREKDIYVVPPLLRKEINNVSVKDGNYLLVYLLNKGYKSDILKWHNDHPEIPIHCFSDDSKIKNEQKIDDNLTFHQLDGLKFLEKMAASMAVVSTAGFESICEAMFMNKPVLMVPVEGHYEQLVNSRDAHYAGAGVFSDRFDIDKLLEYLKKRKRSTQSFKNWANQTEQKIMCVIDRVMND